MSGTAPLIVAVDDDPTRLRDVERELRNRYEPDYRVRCLASAGEAQETLAELAAAGEQVALVLAGERLGGAPGTNLLAGVRDLFPHAQRVLLVRWGHLGDSATGAAISQAISAGRMDQYVVRPGLPPDEQFHQAVSGFLLAWAEARRLAPHTVDVVGETWSGRAYELRSVLERCAIPHRFLLAGSPEGHALVTEAGVERFPAMVMPNGTVLQDPTDVEIARASGTTVTPTATTTTSSSSAGAPRACRRPCTAPPRGCARCSSTPPGSAGRPPPAPRSATTSASRWA